MLFGERTHLDRSVAVVDHRSLHEEVSIVSLVRHGLFLPVWHFVCLTRFEEYDRVPSVVVVRLISVGSNTNDNVDSRHEVQPEERETLLRR